MGGDKKLESKVDLPKWLKPYFLNEEYGILPKLRQTYMPGGQLPSYDPRLSYNYQQHDPSELGRFTPVTGENYRNFVPAGRDLYQNFIAPTEDIYARNTPVNEGVYRRYVDPTGGEYKANVDPTGKEYQRQVDPTGKEYLRFVDPTGEEYGKFVNPSAEIYNRFVNPTGQEYGQFQDLTEKQRGGIAGLADSAAMQDMLAKAGASETFKTLGGAYLNPETNPYLKDTYETAAKGVEDSYRYAAAPEFQAQAMRAGAFGGPAYAQGAWKQRWGLGENLRGLAAEVYGKNYEAERGRMAGSQANLGNVMAQQSMAGDTLYGAGKLERDALQEQEGMRQENAQMARGFGKEEEGIRAGNAQTAQGYRQQEENLREKNALLSRTYEEQRANTEQANALRARGFDQEAAALDQKNALLAREYAQQKTDVDQQNALLQRDFRNEQEEMAQANALAERGYTQEAEQLRQRNEQQRRDFQLEQELVRLQNSKDQRGYLTEAEQTRYDNAMAQRTFSQQEEQLRQQNAGTQYGWKAQEEGVRQQNAQKEVMWPYEMLNQYLASLTGSGQGYSQGSQSNPNANSWVNSLIGAAGTVGGAYLMCCERYKDDIEPMQESDAQKLLDVEPVTFKWRDTPLKSAGVIAEKAVKVMPSLGVYRDGELIGLDGGAMLAMLMGICRNQERRIKELEAKANG